MKNWCSLTCRWMREAGLGEVWTRRDASGDMLGWKETVKNAVMEQESAMWRSAVLGKPKLEPVYAQMKKILECEDYLDHPDVEGRRMLLGMLRDERIEGVGSLWWCWERKRGCHVRCGYARCVLMGWRMKCISCLIARIMRWRGRTCFVFRTRRLGRLRSDEIV